MASSLKKLTGMGGDVRKIAALLQKKAPKGHMLAYISPKEAALLEARGGSGKTHADTGIPSFENEFDAGVYDAGLSYDAPVMNQQTGEAMSPAQVAEANPQLYTPGYDTAFVPSGAGNPPTQIDAATSIQPVFPVVAEGTSSAYTGPRDIGFGVDKYAPETTATGAPKEEAAAKTTATTKEETGGMSKDTKDLLTRAGLIGALGYVGAKSAKKAQEQGQQGRAEMEALAAPYRQQGAQLQAQAQRGELTAAGQQQLQAIQAQAAQGAERRGGVGAAQVQQQVEAYRQQLLTQQYDYGLKLSGIGDNIALGAIKAGLQADQYVNEMNNQFYTNMAYIGVGGVPRG
jgi:hypothetical protein